MAAELPLSPQYGSHHHLAFDCNATPVFFADNRCVYYLARVHRPFSQLIYAFRYISLADHQRAGLCGGESSDNQHPTPVAERAPGRTAWIGLRGNGIAQSEHTKVRAP